MTPDPARRSVLLAASPVGRRTWFARHGVPLLLYAFGYCLLTWPAMLHFSTHFLCDEGDGMQNVWNLWWIRDAAERGLHPWWTDRLFAPYGVTLLGQTLNPVNGILGYPLQAFLTLPQTHNTLVVAAFVLTGWSMFQLALASSGSYAGSLFAGAVLTFSHFHFAHAIGHMQLVTLQWLPLFLLAFWRLVESGGFWRGVGAAGALLLVALSDWYYLLYCVVIGAALVVREALFRHGVAKWVRGPGLAGFAAFGVVAGATTGVLVFRLLWVHRGDPFLLAHDPAGHGLDLLGPFVPSENWRFAEWTAPYWRGLAPLARSESSAYVGWVALLCAFCALRAVRRRGLWFWCGIAVSAYLLALGPRLHAFGAFHSWLSMPYSWLEALVPPLRLSGMPVRFVIVTQLGIAVLAAHGLMPLLRDVVRVRALWPVVALVFAFETWPSVQVLSGTLAPSVVYRLAELPEGVVHGLADDASEMTYGLYYQTIHGKPVTLGYVSREPSSLQPHRKRLAEALAAERYRDLMEAVPVRYLVRRTAATTPSLEAQLTRLWADADYTLWVLPKDPLAADASLQHALAGPHLTSRIESDGNLVLAVTSPRDGGRDLVMLAGSRTTPGLQLWQPWPLPLAIDPELGRYLQGGGAGPFGTPVRLDASGHAELCVPDAARHLGSGVELFVMPLVLQRDRLEPYRAGAVAPIHAR